MVQQYLSQHNPLTSNSALRESGLVAPLTVPDVVRTPGTLEANPMYRLGDAAGGLLENRKLLEPVGRYAQALGSLQGPGGAMVLSALLGAAGGIEAVFSVMALHTGVIPPTINLENPGEGCDLDYVPNVARQARVDVAVSNGFGFGGTNGTLVFRRLT